MSNNDEPHAKQSRVLVSSCKQLQNTCITHLPLEITNKLL